MVSKSEKVPVKREGGSAGALEGGWGPLSTLREEIDDLFDEFASGWALSPFRRRHRGHGRPLRGGLAGWTPRIPPLDVVDNEKEIRIQADLPGVDEDDIDVRVADGSLTISGEKKEEREEGERGGNYYLAERHYGAFHRSIPIPDGIDRDKVEAEFSKGVLVIHLPKTAEAREKSRKVKIKGEK